MAATLSVRPNRAIVDRAQSGLCRPRPPAHHAARMPGTAKSNNGWWGAVLFSPRRPLARTAMASAGGSRADDSSAPFEMSVENALKLLGVSEGASFDDILSAKNSILANCKDDQEAVAQVEAAYDMLLMQSLTQRRAGKVVNSGIRYADVKPINPRGLGPMPQWMQAAVKNSPISLETPPTGNLGIQAGVYGALMVLTYVNGTFPSTGRLYTGADVPGLILATSFGASLYFMTKKNVKEGYCNNCWGACCWCSGGISC
ncbi:uncharacterized protein LOC131156620 isoform X2 [Malania oleifera]|uniref:uncharacterized protein LOC131156620 isoform X2 n=1 Tax=Malania oleifera TaxID=397392 RepID=UPI0025AEA971|nr:uncharacterized protein LOC131156620 isoform X2 [Malania oleifera]